MPQSIMAGKTRKQVAGAGRGGEVTFLSTDRDKSRIVFLSATVSLYP